MKAHTSSLLQSYLDLGDKTSNQKIWKRSVSVNGKIGRFQQTCLSKDRKQWKRKQWRGRERKRKSLEVRLAMSWSLLKWSDLYLHRIDYFYICVKLFVIKIWNIDVCVCVIWLLAKDVLTLSEQKVNQR